MSDVQDTDTTSTDDPNESPVIRALRAELRSAQKELADATKRASEAETKHQSLREEAAEGIVEAFGLPGLKEDVLRWVEGPITQDSVATALKTRGINVTDPSGQQVPSAPATPSASTIGQQVAQAATGGAIKDLDEQLLEAKNRSEVRAMMEASGITRDHR